MAAMQCGASVRRVQLHLHTDRIAKVGELHGARDAAVQLRIDVHDVGAARERKVGLLLKPSYVFRDEQSVRMKVRSRLWATALDEASR